MTSALVETIDEYPDTTFAFVASMQGEVAACPHCEAEIGIHSGRNLHVEQNLNADRTASLYCGACNEFIGEFAPDLPVPIVETLQAIRQELNNVMSDDDLDQQRTRLDRLIELVEAQL